MNTEQRSNGASGDHPQQAVKVRSETRHQSFSRSRNLPIASVIIASIARSRASCPWAVPAAPIRSKLCASRPLCTPASVDQPRYNE
jgi:hypothetical protein